MVDLCHQQQVTQYTCVRVQGRSSGWSITPHSTHIIMISTKELRLSAEVDTLGVGGGELIT